MSNNYPDNKCKVCNEDMNMYGGCGCNGYTYAGNVIEFKNGSKIIPIKSEDAVRGKVREYIIGIDWAKEETE